MYIVGWYNPDYVGQNSGTRHEGVSPATALLGISLKKSANAAIKEVASQPGHYFAFEVVGAEVALEVK